MMRWNALVGAVPSANYSTFQLTSLVSLRMLVGWHILYEGITKLLNPYWTAAEYLAASQWWFSDLLITLAANQSSLAVIDFLNEWGLVLIGLGLIFGFLTRIAISAGIVLLLLYYIAAPPFVGLTYSIPTEGSYLIVNKTLIEMAALAVLLAFPTSRIAGLDRLIFWKADGRNILSEAQA